MGDASPTFPLGFRPGGFLGEGDATKALANNGKRGGGLSRNLNSDRSDGTSDPDNGNPSNDVAGGGRNVAKALASNGAIDKRVDKASDAGNNIIRQ